MKNTILLVLVIALTLSFSSCKDAVEDVIDCTVESAYLSLNTKVDTANIRLIHFTFVNGDTIGNRFSLDNSIRWEFGDGTEETTQGLETSHTYAMQGTYEARAHYTLRNGNASCTSYKERTLSIE
jgi:opacity protein-like surface antigen